MWWGVTEPVIPWAKPYFLGNEKEFVMDALESTWISGGGYIEKFESEFSRVIGSRHTVGVSNGTTALHLAMVAAGIGQGDEVIIPGFTFVAPANTAIMEGAKPVFADVDPDTWLLDSEKIREKITPRTKAIVPVHIYGNVCDMDPIMEIANEHDLMVIEDVAEAPFSKYRGQCAGTFGDLGCFSFQATKTITMGEGGAILTDDDEMDERLRILRSHGMKPGKRYWHDFVGYNYRITNLQAALGYAQLQNHETIIQEKKRVYRRYLDNLADVKGIKLQAVNDAVDPIIWAVAFKLDPSIISLKRDDFISAMKELGIETRPGFYSFSQMPMYDADELPVAEDTARNVVSTPSYAGLDDEEIDFICETLTRLIEGG